MRPKKIANKIVKISNHKYTWKKQHPDIRDFKFSKSPIIDQVKIDQLPKVVSLRRWCSYIEDQSQLGSCTSNAWIALLEYNRNRNKITPYRDFSRLFHYYNERKIEGTINEDSGAEIRDGAKALATYGVCPEWQWPYKISDFRNEPTANCYKNAFPYKIKNYYALETFNDLKISLAAGHPFVFGFYVYDSFESAQVANTGIVPMPNIINEELLGGHAVLAVGYSDIDKTFLCRNSWGRGWGLKGALDGYFLMPYNYLANSELAMDFWTCIS
jgi:C1A family cysteine protease